MFRNAVAVGVRICTDPCYKGVWSNVIRVTKGWGEQMYRKKCYDDDNADELELHPLSRPQVDLAFLRIWFLALWQRLRAIVRVLSAHLCDNVNSTCVCLRLREQCLRSKKRQLLE